MRKGLISVVVPVYNVEEWLDECVSSIVKQTYTNLEIILVDDGSQDGCPKICDEWAKRDDRISVIHKQNGGLSSARNAGLDICNGEYVGFVDSDDTIECEMYKKMLHDIEQNNVKIVMCRTNRVIGDKIVRVGNDYNPEVIAKKEILDNYFYHKKDFCGSVCDKLISYDIIKNIRFPEGLNSEDYYMLIQLYNNVDRMYYSDDFFYNYRLREDTICTIKRLTPHSFDKIKISDMIYEYVTQKMPDRISDADVFRAKIRFAVYYSLMFIEHDRRLEREWKNEMRKYSSVVYHSGKVGIMYKIKYFIFSNFPVAYTKLKSIL